MEDTVVMHDGDFLIIMSRRVFGTGFNCYKREGKSDNFAKINDPLSYFTSAESAEWWLNGLI